MLKKILWPILIGAVLALVLLIIFPTLRNGTQSSFSRSLFDNAPISYYDAVRTAAPAVVNIYSRSVNAVSHQSQNSAITPLGSGVIINNQGYIITNYHVIEGAEQIIVALQDGRIFEALSAGADKLVDIAVLKIEATNIPTIHINTSREPKIGDVVLAIGNPYNIGQTITQGIISATGRDGLSPYRRQNFIQTDASINHGNSGGALVNTKGELVGINTLTFAKNLGNEVPEGIGFAIPTALAMKIMNKLIQDGKIIRGYIGIDGLEFAPTQNPSDMPVVLGILVTNVEGPSLQAGIQTDDILVMVNNKPVKSIVETMDQIAELKPGTVVPIIVLRNGERIELQVTIGQLSV
ncbi:outer membrane-stress sensor serine endopeptidase DegS [Gilliamella sp. Choc4-2]|jgi:serine protease DegS|uniref:outer membrane-stress sensor serine endopeptidase DegS n=1 Tax=unclassified Gilliamella TaxID=2685620 RepID=UPI0004DD792F|nr:outer membrane-stress sensor serine endopeptidase DegS [Gilliamella apicola]KFA58684.1 Outer membrane stress sensor protease DegS [Gilliamella apicola]OCG33002.1 outer membrane-stress sensor serine endopeptidase DegS [Gilliamella apicola]OCG43154.1 outer membrane-stress sensor serine endopeptidase DegS [Gilliamella apicola]OCG53356.1 outer membrane-stress sensor serine endopeptidase DegS [Gilliamella apicola]OCG65052.1 outer membrane-stress sensor serine endopeptidase DegS [Gilliamella apic